MTVDSKESALSRWSRLKAEAREEESVPRMPQESAEPAAAALAKPGEEEALATEPGEQPVLTDADMPDVESLDEDSDFSPFMSAGVSDELRNLALRKLFRAPVFNIRDGLDEYDEDYTTFEKLGDIVTADMKHRVEMQQQKLREKLAEDAETELAEALPEEIDDEMTEEIEDDGDSATTLVADADETDVADETIEMKDSHDE